MRDIAHELAALRMENARLLDENRTLHRINAAGPANYEAVCDEMDAERYDDDDDRLDLRMGCNADDRYDSKGYRLLPRINDAGEPLGYC